MVTQYCDEMFSLFDMPGNRSLDTVESGGEALTDRVFDGAVMPPKCFVNFQGHGIQKSRAYRSTSHCETVW